MHAPNWIVSAPARVGLVAPAIQIRDGHKGVVLVITVALCASFLSEHYGAPVMLFALLIGMAFHFLADDPRCCPGVEFCSKTLLRAGVALLGFRLSLADVAAQGWASAGVIIGLVALTIASGVLLAPLMRRSAQMGVLAGGAVAICGASAALAISAVMPKREGLDGDTLFTVVAVTTMSTIAMVAYPMLFSALGYSDAEAGFLIGATIHDVAQVVGAGYTISEEAGGVATLTKLMRVLLLPAICVILTLTYRAPDAKGVRLPLFVVLFMVFVVINSTGVLPDTLVALLVETSRWMLVIAIAALGVKTSLGVMAGLGARHILLIFIPTLFLLGAAMLAMPLV